MNRDFLKGLLPDASDDVINQIMSANGEDINREKQAVATIQTERDTFKSQLDDANKEIQTYKDMDIEGIKTRATEWETKYQTETQALQSKLDAQEYSFAAERAVSDLQFSSKAAKTAFLSDLKGKGLKLEGGKLLGLDDYVKTYKEADPSAFVDDSGDPPPIIVGKTSGGGGNTADSLRAAFGLSPKKE